MRGVDILHLSSISMWGGGWAWQQSSRLGQLPLSLHTGQTSSWSHVLSFLSSTELTSSGLTNWPTDIALLTEGRGHVCGVWCVSPLLIMSYRCRWCLDYEFVKNNDLIILIETHCEVSEEDFSHVDLRNMNVTNFLCFFLIRVFERERDHFDYKTGRDNI